MIFDNLKNIEKYTGISKNLDKAIDFLKNTDLNTLPTGKNIVDGENVFINVMEAATGLVEERKFELHHVYADIQIDLSGSERIDTGSLTSVVSGEYNSDSDFAFAEADTVASTTIGNGNFVICMPYEPHKPCIAIDEPAPVKKAVVKVKW